MSNNTYGPTVRCLAGLVAVLVIALVPVSSSSAGARRGISTITFVGHGDGPGIGMGQWGAFGYAVRYHLGYEAILDHFYGQTSPASLSTVALGPNPIVAVAILENVNAKGTTGFDPVVTSASAFTIVNGTTTPPSSPTTTTTTTTTPTTTTTSTTSTTTTSTTVVPSTSSTVPTTLPPSSTTSTTSPVSGPINVASGMAVDLRLSAAGTWSVYEAASCTAARQATRQTAPVASGLTNPIVEPLGATPNAAPGTLLTVCRHDGLDETVRGDIEAYDRSGYERTVNLLPMQSYLDGVVPAEESASWGLAGGRSAAPQGQAWGFQALEAQAVAARSYVVAASQSGGWNGYATICDDDACQAYVGANFESTQTDAAVAATAGEIRTATDSGVVVSAQYSASTGGWTVAGAFPAVPDRGDVCVVPGNAAECNPLHTWRVALSGAFLDRNFRAVGRVVRVRVTERDHHGSFGGRALSVAVIGTKQTRSLSGATFAALVGLDSDWFAVASTA